MNRILLLLFFLLPANLVAQDSAPSVDLVPFGSAEGSKRLATSYAVDFYALANEYEPQMNLGTCGPTSAVTCSTRSAGPVTNAALLTRAPSRRTFGRICPKVWTR